MAIYLVQHGQCHAKEEDPHKGLTESGKQEVQRIGQVAVGYGVNIQIIFHSGKKRARQTAEIMAAALGPEKGVQPMDGINPLDDVVACASELDMDANCMVVGHLPFLERLAAYLVTGQHQKPIFQLQNGGILCLGPYGASEEVVVKWALMPNIG